MQTLYGQKIGGFCDLSEHSFLLFPWFLNWKLNFELKLKLNEVPEHLWEQTFVFLLQELIVNCFWRYEGDLWDLLVERVIGDFYRV